MCGNVDSGYLDGFLLRDYYFLGCSCSFQDSATFLGYEFRRKIFECLCKTSQINVLLRRSKEVASEDRSVGDRLVGQVLLTSFAILLACSFFHISVRCDRCTEERYKRMNRNVSTAME